MQALRMIDEVADVVRIRYSKLPVSHFYSHDIPISVSNARLLILMGSEM